MKSFFSVMVEQRNRKEQDVRADLDAIFAAAGPAGLNCPVPNCTCTKKFTRWGSLWDHFVDDYHKKDFFKAFEQRYHRPFCEPSGNEFKHGVRSLMLAMFLQPTSLTAMHAASVRRSKPTASTNLKAKRIRPIEEQQVLLDEPKMAAELPFELKKMFVPTPTGHDAEFDNTPSETKERIEFKKVAESASSNKKSSFARLSDILRESSEINVKWRGKVYLNYVKLFHGIPPCFHCRSAEGKQIHHQNPLFHEIILIALNKWATTAEEVMKDYDSMEASTGTSGLFRRVLAEVVDYHNQEGWVLAVPYCQECNQDAETKRKRLR